MDIIGVKSLKGYLEILDINEQSENKKLIN